MNASVAALLAGLTGVQPVLAADFYAGKTITMSTYGAPGDSYDLYLRLLSRHYGRPHSRQPALHRRSIRPAPAVSSRSTMPACWRRRTARS